MKRVYQNDKPFLISTFSLPSVQIISMFLTSYITSEFTPKELLS